MIRSIRDDFSSWTVMRWWSFCLVTIGYVVAGIVSRSLTFEDLYTPLWLPAGLALAVLGQTSPARWPTWILAILIGNVSFNSFIAPKPPEVLVGFALANLLSAILGARALQVVSRGRLRLDNPRHVLQFAAIGCVLAPLLSSAVGATTLFWASGVAWSTTMLSWSVGNMVGTLIGAPAICLWWECCRHWWRRTENRYAHSPGRRIRSVIDGEDISTSSFFWMVGLLSMLGLVSRIVFWRFDFASSYLVLPCLVLLAIRFEVLGVALGMAVLTWVSLRATGAGVGEFAQQTHLPFRVLLSQLFLASCAFSFLILAASLQQRRRLSETLVRTQTTLASLHHQTRSILDAIPSMVVFQDRAGRLVHVNQSTVDWLGTTSAASDNQPSAIQRSRFLAELGLMSDALACSNEHESSHEVSVVGQEICLMRRDGLTRWVLSDRVPLVDGENRSIGRVTVLTDITQRKLAEQALALSNQDLEHFASIASHDLKEPLRAVGGYCRMLMEDQRGRLDERSVQFLAAAIEGSDRMENQINGLLEYSRVSRGPMPMASVDLNEVASAAVSNLRASIAQSNAEVTVGPLPTVHGCETLLVQVFQNVISNSLKFVAPGQTPRIAITAFDLPATDSFAKHVVNVRDFGIGIAPADQKRVFAIFQRLHLRRQYDGSGLGLAICHRVMDRHGGSIEIESKPESGTLFRLIFPAHPTPQSPSRSIQSLTQRPTDSHTGEVTV